MANHDEVIKGKSAFARVRLQLLTTIAVLGSHMWCKDGIDDDNNYCQHEKDEDDDDSDMVNHEIFVTSSVGLK